LVIVFAVAYLAACTAVADSVVESRYGQYNRSTDWAKNEAILLNIARASEYQPLNFLSFQPYSGTATVSASASSPAFTTGPYLTNSQKQYSFGNGAAGGTAMANGTINVTQMDTQGFYAALLTSVQYSDLYAFERQSYPRELLFRLFTDYVSLKPVSDPQGPYAFILYNDPSRDQQCANLPNVVVDRLYPHEPLVSPLREICFKDLVKFALLSGLSSEIRTIPIPAATGGGAKQPASPTPAAVPGATPGSNSNTPNTTIEGRLCFDGALANRAIMEFERDGIAMPPKTVLYTTEYHPICGGTTGLDKWIDNSTKGPTVALKPTRPAKVAAAPAPAAGPAPATPAPLAAAKSKAKAAAPVLSASAPNSNRAAGVQSLMVLVKTRKPTRFPVWDIHLLGEVSVEIGTRSTFSMYNFLGRLLRDPQSEANVFVGSPEDDEDKYLLTVTKGQAAGCFVSAVFDLGIYCVPIDSAENTKRTFSILSQLLALKTTTGDLQLTPTLRLLPE
jgi:hypothetical protein